MAGPRAVTTPLQPTLVIDLTVSDDEDELQYRTQQSQSSQEFTSLAPQVPFSNHGLILRETFKHDAQIRPGGAYDFNHRPTSPACSQSLRVSSLPNRSQIPIQPQTNPNLSCRPTEQFFPRIVISGLERCGSSQDSPAKRRKTYGGMVSHGKPGPGPARINLSEMSKDSTANDAQLKLPKSTVVLPPNRRVSRTFECHSLSLNSQSSVLVPRSTNLKAERLQADEIGVTLNGVVQSPQNLLRVAPNARAQKLGPNDFVCKQIAKHINSSLEKWHSKIPKSICIKIAQMTAAELVANDGFDEQLKSPQWTKLSEKLARQATFFVDYNATKFLSGRVLDPLESKGKRTQFDRFENELTAKSSKASAVTTENPSTEIPDLVPSLCQQERHPSRANWRLPSRHCKREPPAPTSSRSESEENVFEAPLQAESRSLPQSNNRPSPRSSLSPTTSFSNDANDETNFVDFHIHREAIVPQEQTRSKSLRHLRRSKISKVTPLYHPRGPRQIPNARQQKFDKGLLHKIQAFRLAGGKNAVARPYVSFQDRQDIRRGLEISEKYRGRLFSRLGQDSFGQSIYHVDFCLEELQFLCKIVQAVRKDKTPLSDDMRGQITTLMSGRESVIPNVLSIFQKVVNMPGQEIGRNLLRNRSAAAVEALLRDAVEGKIAVVPKITGIEAPLRRKKSQAQPSISYLLQQREIHGLMPMRLRRGQQQFSHEIANHLEDSLVLKSEWTDCCGDISTLSWTSEDNFVCGATAHSDSYNMQYNKPGNLVVGSCSLDTLRAVADHRIVRRVVGSDENVDNALDSMRQTQDPWLYTSVVSSSHCEITGFTFTASFDETVKVWKVAQNGSSMNLCGTWQHDAKVNFVVTSNHHERVATASDISSNAIRVYHFEGKDISHTPYDTYCGERALEQAQDLQSRETWAYFPATVQWGKSPGVINFLLVGYSPRSFTGQEIDIPEEKKNTGELCLWNVGNGTRVPISSARTQNVFEVVWHPTQPCFLAATSPCGEFNPETRTQVRLFAQNEESGIFGYIKILDCPASDINELTIMPNHRVECYVTASCTDGITYVWDTAQGERPIHALGHGEALDVLPHDLPREVADTGVKFAAWGKTVARLYTGSSDGKVKAWDIRRPKGSAFVRTVLSISGVITAGAFSENYSKLLIGDATGKVHLLGLDDEDDEDPHDNSEKKSIITNRLDHASAVLAKGSQLVIPSLESFYPSTVLVKKPKVIIPHPEPPPPPGFGIHIEGGKATAQEMAKFYVIEGQLQIHPNRAVGAIQGPNYAETRLFRREAHENNDPNQPLISQYKAKQRYEIQSQVNWLKLSFLPKVISSDPLLHERNLKLDLDFSRLSLSTQKELKQDGVDLDFEPAEGFDYELLPSLSIFKDNKKHQKRTSIRSGHIV